MEIDGRDYASFAKELQDIPLEELKVLFKKVKEENPDVCKLFDLFCPLWVEDNKPSPLLGVTVQDKLSSIKGVISGYADYLYSTSMILVNYTDSKGEEKENWFDLSRFSVVKVKNSDNESDL